MARTHDRDQACEEKNSLDHAVRPPNSRCGTDSNARARAPGARGAGSRCRWCRTAVPANGHSPSACVSVFRRGAILRRCGRCPIAARGYFDVGFGLPLVSTSRSVGVGHEHGSTPSTHPYGCVLDHRPCPRVGDVRVRGTGRPPFGEGPPPSMTRQDARAFFGPDSRCTEAFRMRFGIYRIRTGTPCGGEPTHRFHDPGILAFAAGAGASSCTGGEGRLQPMPDPRRSVHDTLTVGVKSSPRQVFRLRRAGPTRGDSA